MFGAAEQGDEHQVDGIRAPASHLPAASSSAVEPLELLLGLAQKGSRISTGKKHLAGYGIFTGEKHQGDC
ncbi:MAG: hypothetical protein Kow00122_17170 [Thermoleophilia bacterium]